MKRLFNHTRYFLNTAIEIHDPPPVNEFFIIPAHAGLERDVSSGPDYPAGRGAQRKRTPHGGGESDHLPVSVYSLQSHIAVDIQSHEARCLACSPATGE
jgi:hypothetical protein